jgi:hypothetical protein
MRDLYLSECRRYLRAALIFAAAHLLLQLFLSRMGSIFQQGWPMPIVILAAYMLAGLGLAVHQIGSYRQPSRWLWLLHRPLAPGAILGALILAAATLIVLAIGLPLLLTVLGTDFLSSRTVDTRHYLAVPYLVMMTLIAWLCGAAIMSSRLRFAFLIVLLPYFMLMHAASAASVLLATLPCAALLAWNVHANFTAGRMPLAGGSAATLAQAAPLLVGMYCLLLWGTMSVFHIVQVGLGQHPQTMALPPDGGHVQTSRADGRSLLMAGLTAAQDARAPHWRQQLALLEVGTLQPTITRYAVRQQLTNQNASSSAELSDLQQRLTFNHDHMRFDVHDIRTGALVNQLGLHGLGDLQAFPGIPVLATSMLTANMVLAVDPSRHVLRPQVILAAGEQLVAAPKKIGERIYILSNGHLNAYAPADTLQSHWLDDELFSLPLPGPLSDLERVDIAPMLDGTLLSFTGGRAMLDGASGSTQAVFFVDADGHAHAIATRAIGHDFPLLFEHADWWLSPAMHALLKLPQLLYADGTVPDLNDGDAGQGTRPWPVWSAALLAALLSFIGAAYWRRKAGGVARGWLLASALLGLPCLLTLLILYPLPQVQRTRQPVDAAAA